MSPQYHEQNMLFGCMEPCLLKTNSSLCLQNLELPGIFTTSQLGAQDGALAVFLGRSPKRALNPFGTLSSIVTPAKSWVKALWHFSTLPTYLP